MYQKEQKMTDILPDQLITARSKIINPNGRRSSKLDKILMNIHTALMDWHVSVCLDHAFLRITKSNIAQKYKWRSVMLEYTRINLRLPNWKKINIIIVN